MNINIPPVTQALILVNVVVYLLSQIFGSGLLVFHEPPFGWFALWPLGMDGYIFQFEPWQLITYAFLHSPDTLAHLFFNMIALFMFGSELERLFGTRWFASYYLVCVVGAAIAQLIVSAVTAGPPYPVVGASGGVFGLLLAYGMYFPHRKLMLIFLPIPLPAWLFVTLYAIAELLFGVTGTMPGVAHFAHLGGMVGGFLMIVNRRGRWGR